MKDYGPIDGQKKGSSEPLYPPHAYKSSSNGGAISKLARQGLFLDKIVAILAAIFDQTVA